MTSIWQARPLRGVRHRAWFSVSATICAALLALVVPLQAVAAASVTGSAKVSAASLAVGGSVTITSTFNSAAALSNIALDVEVRDSANTKVFQTIVTGQAFTAGQSRTVTGTWATTTSSAAGKYTVKLGAFSADYLTSYGWNDAAATIQLTSGGTSTPTTTPTSTPTGTSYFVDCSAGSDARVGNSQAQAWATLARANQATLKPGDALLLKRGCTWTGPLNANWVGTASQPITIGAYGSGALPKIQNFKAWQVQVKGSYLVFDSLWTRADPDFTDPGCKNNRIGYREGFYFDTGSAFNVVQNSYMSDLGGGLEIANGSHNNSIHNNEFANNNMMYDSDQNRNDGGSAAIVVFGDNNDIGFNSIHDSQACSLRYQNGITGHAFDIEAGQGNVFHHNKAWNNGANFAELVNATNTTWAYNVVYNAFTNHTNSKGTKLYNNVFYMPGAGILTCQDCTSSSMTVRNNILVGNTGLYGIGGSITESNNLFWNNGNSVYNTQALNSTSKLADPLFVNPGAGDFHLQTTSPAINAGSIESVNAGWKSDFDRKAVPQGGAVDIGAYELR